LYGGVGDCRGGVDGSGFGIGVNGGNVGYGGVVGGGYDIIL
jgi:hypothetical protein